ncbi:MAG TPA: pseudouridine-5-phosphate glycosidase, partial [Candidatus Lambdaproteobacteria bacterium]|nr:pseudouridine-5-phosphate glycosidase [Candidatus Lambdaproteobacteria bacterium]
MNTTQGMDISAEVQVALETGQPVVALESTIISHGMPYPQNFETAHSVENIIHEEGAVPATIAILEGRIKIGLS